MKRTDDEKREDLRAYCCARDAKRERHAMTLDLLGRVVEAHMGLAWGPARSFARRYGRDVDDCAQDASVGLLRALETYDPAMGYALSTYARLWVLDALQAGLRRERPGPGLRVEPVENGEAPVESVPDLDTLDPEAALLHAETLAPLRGAVDRLPPLERVVLTSGLGLDGSEPRSSVELGLDLGKTRRRVNQIRRNALARLATRLATDLTTTTPVAPRRPGPAPRV